MSIHDFVVWAMDNPHLPKHVKDAILEMYRLHVSGQTKTLADFQRLIPKTPWWRIALPKAMRALWLIPVYMAVALAVDSNVEQEKILSGKGPCAVGTKTKPFSVSESSYGPQSALKDALAELTRLCNASGVVCGDPRCATCDQDVAVSGVTIKNRILWYTADVSGTCGCWCK